MLQAGLLQHTVTAAAIQPDIQPPVTGGQRKVRAAQQEVTHLQVVSHTAIHSRPQEAHVPEAVATVEAVAAAPVPVAEAVAAAAVAVTPAAAVAEEGNSFVSFLYY